MHTSPRVRLIHHFYMSFSCIFFYKQGPRDALKQCEQHEGKFHGWTLDELKPVIYCIHNFLLQESPQNIWLTV